MKIGFDAKSAFHNETDSGNFCRNLISGIFRQNPENEYYLLDTGNPLELPYFHRQLNESQAFWKYESGGPFGKFSKDYGWGKKVRNLKLDVFHGLTSSLPFDWKPGIVKSVVTVHDLIFKRFPEEYKPFERWLHQKKIAFVAKHADLIIATSMQTKSDLERWYPESFGKIELVYQDSDPGFHYRKRPEAVAKILYKFDIVERPYILCVSPLENRKNHKTLVEAFKKVYQHIPEDLVLVGGRGEAADEILDQLGDFEGRLRWLGKVEPDDLVNLYDGASFTAYPSVFEGFGLPILESIRRGKAIVCSKGLCFEEIAGNTAWYSDWSSSDEIAEGLTALSTQPELKKKFEQATTSEAKRFQTRNLLEQIHNCYLKVINLD